MIDDLTERKVQEKIDDVLGNCLVDESDRTDVLTECIADDSFIESLFELLADVDANPNNPASKRVNDCRARQLLDAARLAIRNLSKCRITAEYDYRQSIIDEVISEDVVIYKPDDSHSFFMNSDYSSRDRRMVRASTPDNVLEFKPRS